MEEKGDGEGCDWGGVVGKLRGVGGIDDGGKGDVVGVFEYEGFDIGGFDCSEGVIC